MTTTDDLAASPLSGLLAWGQAGEYNAIDDRSVITALSAGRRGLLTAAVLSAGTGLNVTLAAGWLGVADCGDGTAAVVGSRAALSVPVPAGPATGSLTSYIWCDVSPDAATWTVNVITPTQATGRSGILLGTVTAPAGSNLASQMTLAGAAGTYTEAYAVTTYHASSAPAITSLNDSTWRGVAPAQVAFTLARAADVTVITQMQGAISIANTAVNARLQTLPFLDGAAQSTLPAYALVGQNSGIGQAGPLSGFWRFPAMAAGAHTVMPGYNWNGTANAAAISNTVCLVLVTPVAGTPV
jgi:hypothetical protein